MLEGISEYCRAKYMAIQAVIRFRLYNLTSILLRAPQICIDSGTCHEGSIAPSIHVQALFRLSKSILPRSQDSADAFDYLFLVFIVFPERE